MIIMSWNVDKQSSFPLDSIPVPFTSEVGTGVLQYLGRLHGLSEALQLVKIAVTNSNSPFQRVIVIGCADVNNSDNVASDIWQKSKELRDSHQT